MIPYIHNVSKLIILFIYVANLAWQLAIFLLDEKNSRERDVPERVLVEPQIKGKISKKESNKKKRENEMHLE